MNRIEELYSGKRDTYYNAERVEVVKLVDVKDNRILDIGCGEGSTGQVLKRNGQAKEICGVELMPEAAEQAKKNLDHVIVGNIEKIELPFQPASFDYIIATDVLEHLYDPWRALNRIATFLKDDGQIIVSIPNVQNWRLVRDLIFRGQWKYVDQGLLDRTHLRFFTRKTLVDLLRQSGFTAVRVIPGYMLHPKGYKARIVNILTFGLFRNLLTHQFIAIGRFK